MAVYLDNTIYTNHALRKIGENIIGDYENFNFLKIRVGSGDSTLSQDRTELTSNLYTLRIAKVEYADGIITIRCEIPPELAKIPITEIGLFDTVLGVDHLFSYSKVEIIKPADLGYELTIVLNLGPRTIDFPGVNIFEVPKEKYATRDSLDNFTDMFIYVDTNLERVIHSNAEEIGLNLAEVAYERQLDINDTLRDSTYANLYYSLLVKYGKALTDLYFIHEPNYLSYKINNLAKNESYLKTYHKLFESYQDTISFHDGPIVLAWLSQYDNIGVASTVFNKKDKVNLYFSVDIQQNNEIFKIEKTADMDNPVYHQAVYNEMVITLYGVSGAYTLKYIFDESRKGEYMGQNVPYIFTFNGNFEEPEFHLYIDGVEPELVEAPTEYDSVEMQENRKESDLYGRVILGNVTELLDMPNYSKICPLKNYLNDYSTDEKYSFDNALKTRMIMALKKQVTKYDIAFLSSVMRTLGELDSDTTN